MSASAKLHRSDQLRCKRQQRAGRDVLKEGRNPVIRCYREGHEGYGILFGSVALPAASASVTAWSYPQPIIAWSTCVLRH
jgi:hypothetical protein